MMYYLVVPYSTSFPLPNYYISKHDLFIIERDHKSHFKGWALYTANGDYLRTL